MNDDFLNDQGKCEHFLAQEKDRRELEEAMERLREQCNYVIMPRQHGRAVIKTEFDQLYSRIKKLEKKQKVLQMTPESLENTIRVAKEQERKKIDERTVQLYSASIMMVLFDKFEFNHDKLIEVAKAIQKLYDEILHNYVSFEDICQTLSAEAGIEVKIK